MPKPHEVLAEELGLFAVGVRRELREARDLALAEMRAAVAELRLAVNERLAGIRNGVDGVDGKSGVDGRDGADGAVGPPGAIGEAGPQGLPGNDGRSFNMRGTYEEGGAYRRLDVVAWKNSSFVALLDEPGPCPGDGWQMVAGGGRRGETGATGPQGKSGPQGERGEAGEPGPRLVAGAVDAKTLTLELLHDDGSAVSVDLYQFAEVIRSGI